MSGKKLSGNKVHPHIALNGFKTWIEIDANAARANLRFFQGVVGPRVKTWAVVKSNAYGHGLVLFSKLMQKSGIDGFCVDAPIEGLKLRNEGITKPILVLGATLPQLLHKVADQDVAVTVSNFEALAALIKTKRPPMFHIKIDTGMHRQGFYLEDLPRVVSMLHASRFKLHAQLQGIYTHFASAKDINYPTYTDGQFSKFNIAVGLIARGLRVRPEDLVKHCAATGGALISQKYHCDAVRLGIGLYGLWPSLELEVQMPQVRLRPILSWRTVVGEVKAVRAGDFVGYDLAERIPKDTKIAVLPVGYWHGFSRSLSGVGNVLVRGKRAKVLGRVSMDLVAVDIGNIFAKVGDVATLIGEDKGQELCASDVARLSGTTHYEFLTRLNPLIERVLV